MQKYKYPSTVYLPFTEDRDPDDNMMSWKDYYELISKPIVISEKMDGENTTISRDYYHARSLDSNNHPSRNYVKGIWGNISYIIPPGQRICGENLYAKHSIHYHDLPSYFMVFSIWINEFCCSWEGTEALCDSLGLVTVPLLAPVGIYTHKEIQAIVASLNTEKQEGIVIRTAGEFLMDDFNTSLAKWVRKDHITTSDHWTTQPIVPNKLKR